MQPEYRIQSTVYEARSGLFSSLFPNFENERKLRNRPRLFEYSKNESCGWGEEKKSQSSRFFKKKRTILKSHLNDMYGRSEKILDLISEWKDRGCINLTVVQSDRQICTLSLLNCHTSGLLNLHFYEASYSLVEIQATGGQRERRRLA